MKYWIKHHQHKAKPLDQALKSEGWIRTPSNADIALLDRDFLILHNKEPRPILVQRAKQGATIVIYPHSVLPPWWYDGLTPIHEKVACILVHGEAHKKAMKIIAPKARTEVIGWYHCPIKLYKAKPIRRILFAPIHPSGRRELRSEAKEANIQILEALIKLKSKPAYKHTQIVIRSIYPLDWQGLWNNAKIIYQQGKPNGSYKDIDEADLIICEGTFMYLAVARGKPVIGINQDKSPRPNHNPENFKLKTFNQWGKIIAYPINFGDLPLIELIDKAMDGEQSQWRQNNLGMPLNPKNFSKLLIEIRRKSNHHGTL